MEMIEQRLSDYVWDNLSELKSIFSEKVYRILSRFREKKDKEGFRDTLGLVLESDKELLLKIKSESEDIENMSMEEVVKALNITSYDSFIDKKKYIDRAEYLVDRYKKEDETYAVLLNNLARFYNSMGDYEKAEPLYLKALKINEKILGNKYPDTATSYNNLAELYWLIGEYQKAEPLYLKALTIRKKVFSEEHPNTATSYNNLAGLYNSMGVSEKAEPLYLKASKINEKILGEEHPST